MNRTAINPWTWSLPLGYNQAEAVTGATRHLTVAGQTSVDADGAPLHGDDMRAQIAQSLDNLETVLTAADMSLSDITQLRVYATDVDAALANFDLIGMRFGAAGAAPPMTLLGVTRLALAPLMFEIEAIAAACGHAMRRAERLFRLVDELRSRKLSRASDLAAALEISVRTVYRDIAHLQASGLPIDGEAGVGYVLRPGFDVPNVTFTHDQIDALALGLSMVEGAGDRVLSAAAQEVRLKLQAALPDPEDRRVLAEAPLLSINEASASGEITQIRHAIRARLVLDMAYGTPGKPAARRCLRPLALWQMQGGWMASGWCELRAGFRNFRVDRIEQLTVTDRSFADDPNTGYAAYIAHERATDTRSAPAS